MSFFKRPATESQNENLFSAHKAAFKFLFILPMFSYSQKHDFIYWLKFGIFHIMSLFTILSLLHVFVCFPFPYCFDIDKSDYAIVAISATHYLCFLLGFISLSYMTYKRKDLEQLFKFADECFKWHSASDTTHVRINKSLMLVKVLHIPWVIANAGLFFGSITYYLFLVEIPHHADSVDRTKHLLSASIKFLHLYATIVTVMVLLCGSSLFVSLIIQCCSQYDFISCRLENIFYTSGRFSTRLTIAGINSAEGLHSNEKNKSNENDDISGNCIDAIRTVSAHVAGSDAIGDDNQISDIGRMREFRAELKSCVDQQNNIIHLCNLMEDFFHPFTFLRLIEITLSMCFSAYGAASGRNFDIRFISELITSITLRATELYLLTYPAEILSHQNERVGEALMRTPWYLVMHKFRNDFCIILAFAKRQTKLTALKMFTLNADLFRKVVSATYSYYTFLRSFNK